MNNCKYCNNPCKNKFCSSSCSAKYNYKNNPNFGMRNKSHPNFGFEKGHIPFNKGKKQEEFISSKKLINVRKTQFKKGKHYSSNTEIKKGQHLSSKTEFEKGQFSLSKNPNWQGGKSFELYGTAFNSKLKEFIQERDNYRCQECFRHQSELRSKTNKPYKLHIHHIDFNKKNNKPSNLISLCRNCHTKTEYNRKKWISYYQRKINLKI